VPLQLAFCHSTPCALAQVPKLDDPLLHAHDPPPLIVQVFHIRSPRLFECEIIKALEHAVPVHIHTFTRVRVQGPDSRHGVARLSPYPILAGKGESAKLRASTGRVAGSAIERPKASAPAVGRAALAATARTL